MAYVKDRSTYASATYRTVNTGGTAASYTKVYKITRTRTGNANPKWREQVDKHTNATTSMSGEFVTYRSIPSSTNVNVTKTSRQSAGGHICFHRYPDPGKATLSMGRAREIAVRKFLKKLRKTQTAFGGMIFLGELRETLHMLRRPAESLVKAMRYSYLDKLKGIKKRDPKRWRRAISGTWLEASFGWLPFVNDLEDAAEAYQELTNRRAEEFRSIRASGEDVGNASSSTELFAPVGNYYHRGSTVRFDTAICTIRGQVKAQAVTTAIDRIKFFGLRSEEFIPTAWELLPWSFLVDYFTNIGDILEAATTHTSSLAWVSEAQVGYRTLTAVVAPDVPQLKQVQQGQYVSTGLSPSLATWHHRSVVRTPDPQLSIPPLRFELPGKRSQLLNIGALLVQANSGLHQQRWRP